MQAYASEAAREAFAASYARVDTVVEWLCGPQAAQMTHAQLEDRLHTDGLAVLRQLLQDCRALRPGVRPPPASAGRNRPWRLRCQRRHGGGRAPTHSSVCRDARQRARVHE